MFSFTSWLCSFHLYRCKLYFRWELKTQSDDCLRFMKRGCAADLWINILLWILGWIPGEWWCTNSYIYIQGSEMCFCSALRLTLNVGNADWIIFRGFACLVDHLQIRAPWRSPCRIHLSLLSVGHQTIIEVICLARGFLCSCWTSILVILSWGRRGIMERRRKIYGYNWLTISMAHLTC